MARLKAASFVLVLLVSLSALTAGCRKSEPQEPQENAAAGVQTVCPVMGGKIQEDVYTEYQGKKVYFCCPACVEKFKADPEKYLSKLPQFAD